MPILTSNLARAAVTFPPDISIDAFTASPQKYLSDPEFPKELRKPIVDSLAQAIQLIFLCGAGFAGVLVLVSFGVRKRSLPAVSGK